MLPKSFVQTGSPENSYIMVYMNKRIFEANGKQKNIAVINRYLTKKNSITLLFVIVI